MSRYKASYMQGQKDMRRCVVARLITFELDEAAGVAEQAPMFERTQVSGQVTEAINEDDPPLTMTAAHAEVAINEINAKLECLSEIQTKIISKIVVESVEPKDELTDVQRIAVSLCCNYMQERPVFSSQSVSTLARRCRELAKELLKGEQE